MTKQSITKSLNHHRRLSRTRLSRVGALVAALFALSLVVAPGATAQDAGGSDEDDLFSGSLIEEERDEEASATAGVEDLLTSEVAMIGGQFGLSVRLSADPEAVESIDDISSSYSLSPAVYIDSRPDADFRVFVKTNLEYTTASANAGASLNVEELFSDVTLGDRLYLRAGKQNMAWGVGHFFSPADLVSLEAIDPDDAEADLEGPVAVRLHLPYKTTNAYAYSMLDDLPDGGSAGWAGKLEFVLGTAEIALGGYHEDGSVSGAMTTVSAGIWDIDVFAEGVAQYGSTFAMVREDGPALVADLRSDTWFALATVGGRYSWSDDYDYFSLSVLGQYYFNGSGYEDPAILQDPRIPALIVAGDLGPGDLTGTGRHYAAASVRWSQAFGSDLSPSAFWNGNLSDGSGRLSIDFRYAWGDYVAITPGYVFTYGEPGEEYAPGGEGHRVSVNVSLGRGAF